MFFLPVALDGMGRIFTFLTMFDKYLNRKQKIKLTLWLFKHFPVLGELLMMAYVAFLLHGYNLMVMENVTRDVFLSMLMCLFVLINGVLMFVSDILGFCWLHRAMFGYMALVGLCICYEQFVGFGDMLTPSRWLILGIGAVLNAYIITHWKKYKECNKNACNYD